MGKSRAAAFSLGVQDIDGGVHVNSYSENCDSIYADYENTVAEGRLFYFPSCRLHAHCKVSSVSNGLGSKEKIVGLLASLMEVVQSTVAWECFYVREMVVDALIWIQSPQRSFDELEYIIASELSDPAWPATLFMLHARFKATPNMAVTPLEIAREFATKVPGKIDVDVLQLLGKTCLVGAGHGSIDRVSASDPKSALALQRLVQAAVMFLGENVNYAASEYAWESTTPPGTALMMLEADKLVAAAISRNPTLAGALTQPQGCAFSGTWEV
ncbi:uncharacterized protein LOC132278807 [Cornus florida]|uniref:uncharacterized protein LOC132278807 n=1 Tax=Cornus florida TaxID=4283 RepID=UPI0028A1CDE4|nr:uncharacterized protein LOC132278807 [Cornus florida]